MHYFNIFVPSSQFCCELAAAKKKKKKRLFFKNIKVVHDFILTSNYLPWIDLFKIFLYKVISFSTLLKIKLNKEKKINIEMLLIFYFLHSTLSKSCFYKRPVLNKILMKILSENYSANTLKSVWSFISYLKN